MNKEQFKQAIEAVRKNSPKRKFTQRFDLIINLKDVNLKDVSQQIDSFIHLHFSKGRKTKVCALVGPELAKQAKEVCDFFVHQDDFEKYVRDKKLTKKLANDYDFFIAQANLMTDVAKSFGRVFGPKGKMPNPKAGCVVPPTANLKPLYERLQKTVRVAAKTAPSIQVLVGSEEMDDAEVLDNIMTVYSQVLHMLPSEKNNVKNVYLKLTMGNSVKIGAKEEAVVQKAEPEEKAEAKSEPAKSKKPAKKAEPKLEPEVPKSRSEASRKAKPKKSES